jgi:hypothetical protein
MFLWEWYRTFLRLLCSVGWMEFVQSIVLIDVLILEASVEGLSGLWIIVLIHLCTNIKKLGCSNDRHIIVTKVHACCSGPIASLRIRH